MDAPERTMVERIAQASIACNQRTGNHVRKSVKVVLSEGTLEVTLSGALSPAERVLAPNSAGVIEVPKVHRKLSYQPYQQKE